jgi:hypothetical protein
MKSKTNEVHEAEMKGSSSDIGGKQYDNDANGQQDAQGNAQFSRRVMGRRAHPLSSLGHSPQPLLSLR